MFSELPVYHAISTIHNMHVCHREIISVGLEDWTLFGAIIQ